MSVRHQQFSDTFLQVLQSLMTKHPNSAFFQSMFTKTDNYLSSDIATGIHLDAIAGTANVMFLDDDTMYRYSNLSRDAIAEFITNDARSMDEFINTVLKSDKAKIEEIESDDSEPD